MTTNKPGYLRQYYAEQKALLVESLGGQCVVCGAGEESRLEIHHIDGWKGPQKGAKGRGRLDRLTDWKVQAKVGGVVLLCNECHKRKHGRKEREPIHTGWEEDENGLYRYGPEECT